MKYKFSLCFILLVFLFSKCKPTEKINQPVSIMEPPKLMLVISVDQMRYDFLERFQPYFKHGFRRLLAEGAVFSKAHHEHSLNGTSPGHATIATGCYPTNHGIIENDFFNPRTGDIEYSVEDTAVQVIGVAHSGKLKGMSPAKLWKPTMGDRLKAKSPQSKVYGVAFKDRSSILLAGKKADAAYWYDNLSSRFVSSDWYGKAYPEWAKTLVGKEMMKTEIEAGWQKKMPESDYSVSREDDFEREMGQFIPTFPHTRERMGPGIPSSWRNTLMLWNTPFGDAFAIEFAKALIENEGLGMDAHPDLLLLSCSTADAVGHHFGPYSQEVQDYYMHLDDYLGGLFDFLDQKVGAANYAVALSSDHGSARMPEDLARQGLDAKRISQTQFEADMDAVEKQLQTELKLTQPLFYFYSPQGLSLNYLETREKGINDTRLRKKVAAALKSIDYIVETYIAEELQKGIKAKKSYQSWFQRSYHLERGNEIKMLFKKFYLVAYKENGTTHGTPYEYDSNVPLVLMGKPFPKGNYPQPVATVDIAPTILKALGIKRLRGMDGKVIQMDLLSQK